jgi:signal transduction histidine kinase
MQDALPPIQLDHQAQRHLLLAVKEALHNAVKHAQATYITLHLSAEDNTLFIRIADNGSGFDADTTKRHSGLLHLEQRANSIGARYQIDTALGKGTKVSFWYRM